MGIEVAKMNPAGNMTILVSTPIPTDYQAQLSHILLQDNHMGAEQVGFLSKPTESEDVDLHLRMMGGEFCGNATRSAAVYAVHKGMIPVTENGDYKPSIFCSGSLHPIRCHVKPTCHEGAYWAEAHMPSPLRIATNTVSTSIGPIVVSAVVFPGITHFIVPCPSLTDVSGPVPPELERLATELSDILPTEALAAYGILFYNTNTHHMRPVVYVRDTDSRYWESSCASGTTAIGITKFHFTPTSGGLSLSIHQPGGDLTIRIAATPTGYSCYLGGIVQLVTDGTAYVPLVEHLV